MKPKTLLVLTVVVAVFAAFIFFFEKDLPSTDERAEMEKKVLAPLKDDEVKAVEITWEGQTVRLERRESAKASDEKGESEAPKPETEWRLTKPIEARADKTTVESLLRSLTGLKKERTVTGMDRADAGLDQPRARVSLETESGENVLEIGSEVPGTSDMLVAQGGESEIHQVAKTVWNDLTREPADWRDKHLFRASRSEVERMTLRRGDESVLLGRRAEDFWIESPIVDRADKDLVNSLLNEVTGLVAEAFIDESQEPQATVGLTDAESGVLEVVIRGEEEPFRLELGSTLPGADPETASEEAPRTYYARVGGELVEVKTRLAGELARTPAEWRSRSWTSYQVYQIDEARFEDAQGAVDLHRVEGDWLRGEDRVPYTAASDVLYAIADAKAEEVLDAAAASERGFALGEPELRAVLTTKDGAENLELYPLHDGHAAARSVGRDAVLVFSAERVDEVHSKLAELRKAEPLPDEKKGEGGDEGE